MELKLSEEPVLRWLAESSLGWPYCRSISAADLFSFESVDYPAVMFDAGFSGLDLAPHNLGADGLHARC